MSEPITDFTSQELAERYAPLGMTPSLARRLQSSALRRGLWPTHDTTISARWLDRMRQELHLPELTLLDRRVSSGDGFAKYLFASGDGARFEAVLIPLLHRPGAQKAVVCVSTQVGCAMGCAFCATGRMGFTRNLATWEIVAQVAQIRRDTALPVRGAVFMGMGEPLLNYEAVIRAASIFAEPSGLAIAAKAITLSTAGVVPGIRRLTREGHAYRLVVSLTSADPARRRAVMPAEGAYPSSELRAALADYHAATGRRVTLAWTLIAGFNAREEDARQLAEWVGDLPVQIDLIDVNDTTGAFSPPGDAERNAFRDALRAQLAAPVIRRYSGGQDIEAACGMLAVRPKVRANGFDSLMPDNLI
jgi:23S rRNA (adenine2503-C2)-methyltransferase